MGTLLPPDAVDIVPDSVSEAEFSLLGDTFEAVPAPVPEAPPLVGDTVLPLPPAREEVPLIIVAVLLPLAPPLDAVALPPPMVGLTLALSVLVTDGLPIPALLLAEFGLEDAVVADGHTVGPGAP